MQSRQDSKDNLVNVTIFESNLSQFILEHPEFYQSLYIRLLTALEKFINKNRNDKASQRYLSNMLYQLNKTYGHANSFTELKQHFSLITVKHCIKKCCDNLLEFNRSDKLPWSSEAETLAQLSQKSLFSIPRSGMFRLKRQLRPNELFLDANRGVKRKEIDNMESSVHLGIVEEAYVPDNLKSYFTVPNYCAGFEYLPDYDGNVANWLFDRSLPVISGASGSIEQVLTRLLPLVNFSREEVRLLLLAHTIGMIAMGHHSFFECMLVADRYGFRLQETKTLLDFYLQCIPETVLQHQDFKDFLQSDRGATLIADMPLFMRRHETHCSIN